MQSCSICSGPAERANKINELLRKKISFKQIALTIGDVSKASIGRHALKCLTTKTKKILRNQIPIVVGMYGSPPFIRRDYGTRGCSITFVTPEQIRALDDDEYCIWHVEYEKLSPEAEANLANMAAERQAAILAAIEADKQAAIVAIEPETPPENQPVPQGNQ